MTVIAVRGNTMAADRQCEINYAVHKRCKVTLHDMHGVDDCVAIRSMAVGGAGESSVIEEMKAWVVKDGKVGNFPKSAREAEQSSTLLVLIRSIDDKISLWAYNKGPYPIKMENEFCAIGSGGEAAMAAMHMGASASEAVRIASLVSSGCGGGVDEVSV